METMQLSQKVNEMRKVSNYLDGKTPLRSWLVLQYFHKSNGTESMSIIFELDRKLIDF